MDRPRFIVDEDLPRSLHRALREAGFDAVDVRDVGLRGLPDDHVLEEAIRQHRTLLTGDLGFGNLIRFPLGSHHGIAVARFSTQMPAAEVTRIIVDTVETLTTVDLRGALVVIEPDRVRLRLPEDSRLRAHRTVAARNLVSTSDSPNRERRYPLEQYELPFAPLPENLSLQGARPLP